ncbi:MAG: hypothetical protein IPL35_15225 [Sphingobacteriales bacterium]|nr:hypothetical protein [Sphingobacteriales bacterium]
MRRWTRPPTFRDEELAARLRLHLLCFTAGSTTKVHQYHPLCWAEKRRYDRLFLLKIPANESLVGGDVSGRNCRAHFNVSGCPQRAVGDSGMMLPRPMI